MEIGGYSLGQRLDRDAHLVEVGPAEYAILGRTFETEGIFRAGTTSFLGHPASLMVGAIDGRVYKLALQFEPDSASSSAALLSEIAHYCDGQFGSSAPGPDAATVVWDAAFGNVVLDSRAALAQHRVNLFLTDATLARSARPLLPERELQARYARQVELLNALSELPPADPSDGPVPQPTSDEIDRFLFRNLGRWVALAWKHGIVDPPETVAFGTHLATHLLCQPGGAIFGLHLCWLVRESGSFFKSRDILFSGTAWRFRYETLRKFHLSELPSGDLQDLQLPDLSELDSASAELRDFRKLRGIDEFRFPGVPDDIRVEYGPDFKLTSEINASEHLWVRVSGVIGAGEYSGELLNTPHFCAGAAGDRVSVRLITAKGKKALVASLVCTP